jgi:predicted XRE-type DNA-binding protein
MNSISFGNAFDVITNNKGEANELQVRADLMIALRGIAEGKGWKLAEAGEVFKLSQQQVGDLLQGKIDKFSIDLLMSCFHRYSCAHPTS